MHGSSKWSDWSGIGTTIFSQTELALAQFEYAQRTSKASHLRKLLSIVVQFLRTKLRWHAHHFAEVKRKHKPGLQSGPGLLLVSGLGFALEQSCFA